MNTRKRIACFEDTLSQCFSPELGEATRRAVDSGRVYPEDFRTSRLHPVWESVIRVEERCSFQAARDHLPFGRVAVLNFANPKRPGGGVAQGAQAQEESLCRSSNLYPCLTDERIWADYYGYHEFWKDHFFSNRVIYHRDVTVFKTDEELPVMMDRGDWFQVDVITCAAPYLGKQRYSNATVLGELFCARIRQILEAAMDNEAEVLILGAFGCGAFKNPPQVVARAFRLVLEEERYRTAFKRVVFAVKSSVGGDPYTVCPNIAAFQLEFLGESLELEKLRYVGGARQDPGMEDVRMPGGRIRYRGSESQAFFRWQRQNPYYGKQFSVLGDSISTLEGYIPRGYRVYYTQQIAENTQVRNPEDTWWGQVIQFFGGELLVNDSWSGSRVTRWEDWIDPFPSAVSDRRLGNLRMHNVKPDVILVYLGMNDWGGGVKLGADRTEDTFFVPAYRQMLGKLRSLYPDAEIWCCTLNRSHMSSNPNFVFREELFGTNIREYNAQIAAAVRDCGCRLLDLYSQQVSYDTVDSTHPSKQGMDTLAALVVRQMADAEGAALLDCEQCRDVVRDVCQQCGKRFRTENPDTAVLRLRFLPTGETWSISGNRVVVGRSRECEMQLDSPYVARSQATFICSEGQWYLRDNSTKNGTYLNGVRLEPDRLSRVRRGDIISFAQKEEVEFLS